MNTKRDWLLGAWGATAGFAGVSAANGEWLGVILFFAAALWCRLKAGVDKGSVSL